MTKHRVVKHISIQGRTEVLDYWFDSLELAIEHVKSSQSHAFKIFDETDNLVATGLSTGSDSYA
jgi:hypothetical protein